MEQRVHSVPYALREAFVLTDSFATHLKQQGWQLRDHRPIYTDPQVIRQKWLLCPGGRSYSDVEFYHLFGSWHFRMLLRTLSETTKISNDVFSPSSPFGSNTDSFLTFLQDQELLLQTKTGYRRGPALGSIQGIGHTLEWWCAEWLRRTFAHYGQVPARHGVTLIEMMQNGDTGDFDVLAFLGNTFLLVDCKSSLIPLDPPTLHLFFWRAAQLEPDLAILLVDVPHDQTKQQLAKVQRRLTQWHMKPVEGDGGQGVYWNEGRSVTARGPGTRSVYWDQGIIYAAFSTEHSSLEKVLSTVLHHYHMRESSVITDIHMDQKK